jgi:hypothetical protein
MSVQKRSEEITYLITLLHTMMTCGTYQVTDQKQHIFTPLETILDGLTSMGRKPPVTSDNTCNMEKNTCLGKEPTNILVDEAAYVEKYMFWKKVSQPTNILVDKQHM